jgi:hypothetical protein
VHKGVSTVLSINRQANRMLQHGFEALSDYIAGAVIVRGIMLVLVI